MKISPKVKISDRCIHRYGMIAVEPIEKSEILFEIPHSLFLWEENSSKPSGLPGLSILTSESGWVKLLLVLMLEYTDGKNSKWWPYLQFAPPVGVLDTPIFWPKEIRQTILGGTSLYTLVERDVENICKEYNELALPYIKSNEALGYDENKHTLELFAHMVGFVMAYSFTNPDSETDGKNAPKMVPMADVLNHISKHNAHLQFDEDSWKMVAVRSIYPQEEVFNTFGFLSNSQLLQMYGFVEDNSSSDTVEIPTALFRDYPLIESCEKKWAYLFHDTDGILAGCDSITVGVKGILSCEEVKVILKVLSMSSSEFISYDGDSWESSSESEHSNSSTDSIYTIPFKTIETFESTQKSLLKHAANSYHGQLHQLSLEKGEINFSDEKNTLRLKKVLILLKGQLTILENLILSCS